MPISRQRLTEFPIQKGGVVEGMPGFATWVVVKPCNGEECSIFSSCTYDKQGSCLVEKKFLNAVFAPLEDLMLQAKDPLLNTFIGMQLLPAYHLLIKLKKKELSLSDPTLSTAKGDIRPHPVYEMIVKQERVIMELWNKMGILRLAEQCGFMVAEQNIKDITDEVINGDPEYYSEMSNPSPPES